MGYRTVAYDANYDLEIVNGRARMLEGGEAIAQGVSSWLLAVKGEWWIDLSVGVPLWDEVLVHNPEAPMLEVIFADAVRKRPGIVGLTSLELGLDDNDPRKLRVSFIARADGAEPIRVMNLKLR